ncbi:MAG: ABC transporter ATP-binding protein [Bulleidia sp.]
MSIQVSHLSFSYSEDGPSVLDDLSVTIDPEDISLIVGNTGEGKSTFLYLAAGLYPHYAGIQKSGTIAVEDRDLMELDPSERCRIAGMMFQNPDLQFCMDTVINEMIFCLENIREDTSCFQNRIEEALQFCGIAHLRNRKLVTLSGGEKQKVALACVMLLKPKWVFLDEPFASIDTSSREFLVEKLGQIHEEYGTGIMAVDHHPENWKGAATAVFRMSHGKLHRETTDSLMQAPVYSVPEEADQRIGDVVLQLNDVSVWHENVHHPVLEHVNLSLRQGRSYAILGESGAGKSSLFGAILGLYPYHGTIRFRNQDIQKRRSHLNGAIGMITQSPQDQFIGGTVKDEIAAVFSEDPEAKKKVQEILKKCCLWKYRNLSPYQLSHGQQRRLAAATMISSHCSLLLCDEPTCAQDAESAGRIMTSLLHQARQNQIAFVFSTHEHEIAEGFADEIWMIEDHTLVRRR